MSSKNNSINGSAIELSEIIVVENSEPREEITCAICLIDCCRQDMIQLKNCLCIFCKQVSIFKTFTSELTY